MNYRHAYHAGNHADVLKHAVLALALDHLNHKDKPFCVLDAHAGVGLYDLRSTEAVKTGEWQTGFAMMKDRFSDDVEALFAPYRNAIDHVQRATGAHVYPGSPALSLALLRETDKLICNELHPEDHALLENAIGHDPRGRITQRDAVQSVKAELPPNPKRGLVLIDSPYEDKRETEYALKALSEGYRRFAAGVYLVWYPVKGAHFAEDFMAQATALAIPNMLSCELRVKESFDGGGLAGSGMVIVNPPYQFEDKLKVMLPALAQRLGVGKWGRGTVKWLTAPRS
jgi:23S rRNA (adenine2030-N6)-methyltransferase